MAGCSIGPGVAGALSLVLVAGARGSHGEPEADPVATPAEELDSESGATASTAEATTGPQTTANFPRPRRRVAPTHRRPTRPRLSPRAPSSNGQHHR